MSYCWIKISMYNRLVEKKITAETIELQFNHPAKKKDDQLFYFAAKTRLYGGVKCSSFYGRVNKPLLMFYNIQFFVIFPYTQKREKKI